MINAINIIPAKTASCSVMGDYAIKKKMNIPKGKAKRGDLVLFDFNHNGTSDHIGIVVSVNSGSYTTIEGNTSGSNDTNGGGVCVRTRYNSQINYFVRPAYSNAVTADMVIATAQAEVGTVESPRNSNKVKYNTWFYDKEVQGKAYPWCAAFICWVFAHVQEAVKPVVKPTGKYGGTIPKPTLKKGSKGDSVKNLQKFLNWYHPDWKLSVDGGFGANTYNALVGFQKTEGIGADGVYGNQSYTKAKAYEYIAPTTPTTTLKKPTGKYSGTIPTPTLKKGSKGTSVKNLQKFLNWYGGFKLSVDGGFGAKTESALKTFQKTEGISADGVYGKKSQAKAKAYKASSPAPAPTPAPTGNAEKLVAKMKELSWAYGTAKSKYAYKGGSPTSACKTAMGKYGYKTKAKWSDCGNFVNTVVRSSGVDPNFTSLHGVKKAFPKSEAKFNIVHTGAIPSGFLKAGDIIRYKKTNNDQHAMFYFGDGKVCDAGHYNRFGNIRKDEKRYTGSKVKKSTIQVLRAK